MYNITYCKLCTLAYVYVYLIVLDIFMLHTYDELITAKLVFQTKFKADKVNVCHLHIFIEDDQTHLPQDQTLKTSWLISATCVMSMHGKTSIQPLLTSLFC